MGFIHSSIKTRIETFGMCRDFSLYGLVLYIVPLKQGLKPPNRQGFLSFRDRFIHSSIKTRIETLEFFVSYLVSNRFYT